MALAPDRISIKRRRDDEIVDVLTLTRNKKQRTADHFFVRLGCENAISPTNHSSNSSPPHKHSQTPVGQSSGVPVVGTTRPGDEIRDFQNYKATQDRRNGHVRDSAHPTEISSSHVPPDARRFHLTRDLSTASRPQQFSTFQNPKSLLRPHLPTFVERSHDSNTDDVTSHAAPPIDRIIKAIDGDNHTLDAQRILAGDGSVTREKTSTFQKPASRLVRTGQSIQDDLATWDFTSDRLADELMTLAMEMDPDAKARFETDPASSLSTLPQASGPDSMMLDGPLDYVFETYIRVQQKSMAEIEDLTHIKNMGYLVIDEEEEDLWEQYLREDDDDDEDWDEEDGDSNAEDNPRNDYPEDEVSSDDEYGRNIYQYRRDHSDDEDEFARGFR